MKAIKPKTIFSLFFLTFFIGVFSQNSAIEQANKLIALQRYASAYDFLRGSDPNDQSPEIAIARTNLLLNYYIKTDKFQSFGLRDIAPNQNLQDFRSQNANVKMLSYKPDSILAKLIYQYPSNYKLHYALGNFYYEVRLVYPDDNWILPDSVLVDNIKIHYLEAYKNNEFDYWSLFGIGYAYLLDEDVDKAIPFLEKSIDSNPDYPLSYYNLAVAYQEKKVYDKALKLAQKAYELQTIPEFKSETAILIGSIYKNQKNFPKALEYLVIANKLFPKDYDALVPLLELEVQLNLPIYPKRTNELFMLGPENPIIYQDIMKIYSENEKDKEFINFLETKKNEFRASMPISANIHFYQAIAQYENDDWVVAKMNFEKARNLFRSFYKSDHNVFKVIDSYTEAIKKKK